ncbi:MAG: response regulator [Desulfovibrionaceae bacterium]|nr:response regulator [Desulfovibrionaceae bacterium]MBF0512875.1 response regulator [Desulfovibrionaceae bacterium]
MKSISLLIVDDSSTVRHLIAKYVKSILGIDTILTAQNGKEAFEIFQNNEIDIVISDWDMPVMTGEELLFDIRNKSKNKNVPFIMVTSHAEKDFIITAIQNGVNHYIVKPFTAADIERKITECLKLSKRRSYPRYSNLPAHNAFVTFKPSVLEANVVDISLEGSQIEFNYQDDITLFKQCLVNIDLALPGSPKKLFIGPIAAMVIRLEASDYANASSKLCRMGLYFSRDSVDKAVVKKLETLIDWLHSNSPEMHP